MMISVIALWLAGNAIIAVAIFTRPIGRERGVDRSQFRERGVDRRAQDF